MTRVLCNLSRDCDADVFPGPGIICVYNDTANTSCVHTYGSSGRLGEDRTCRGRMAVLAHDRTFPDTFYLLYHYAFPNNQQDYNVQYMSLEHDSLNIGNIVIYSQKIQKKPCNL